MDVNEVDGDGIGHLINSPHDVESGDYVPVLMW